MIDPNNITTVRVGQLPEAPFNGTDNIPHEIGTDLKRGTITDLANFIATIIGTTDSVAFLPITVTDGQTIPNTTSNEWFLAGKGTFYQNGGYPPIVCTEELNAIIGNGIFWVLGVEIPIVVDPAASMITQDITLGVTDYAPSSDAVYKAFETKNPQQFQLVANMQSNWSEDAIGTKYPQFEMTRNAIANIVLAFGCSGLTNREDTVALQDISNTVLRVTANDSPFMFYANINAGIDNVFKLFPQQDFPLANIPDITTNGVFLRYVAYLDDGTLHFSKDSYFEDDSYCQIGRIAVNRVAGVTTFIDAFGTSSRNVRTIPDIAGYNNLLRLYAPLSSDVELKPNTNLTVNHAGGNITGQSINWGSANPNLRTVLAQNPVQFIYINPSTSSSAVVPPTVTNMNFMQYWNGTAVVAVPANTNATVQRVLISDGGTISIQLAEVVFDNFQEAKDGVSTAPFTTILPKASYTEIGRIVAVKTVSNLQNEADAQFYASGSAGSSGGGSASAGTDIGVILGATQALVTSSTGLDGAIPLASSGVAGLLSGSNQTIYGEKSFNTTPNFNSGFIRIYDYVDLTGYLSIEANKGEFRFKDIAGVNKFAMVLDGFTSRNSLGFLASFSTTALTTSQNYYMPNATGTFALLDDVVTTHNALTDIQGGTTNDYQHLTTDEARIVKGTSPLVIKDSAGTTIQGSLKYDAIGKAISLARLEPNGDVNEGYGAVHLLSGSVGISGDAIRLNALQDPNGGPVYATPGGTLYVGSPPIPAWELSDTDTGTYTTTAGTYPNTWVKFTNLFITTANAVSLGDIITAFFSVFIINESQTDGGTIEFGFGIDNADPLTAKEFGISSGFNNVVAGEYTVNALANIPIGSKVQLAMRLKSAEGNTFRVTAFGASNPHDMTISVPASTPDTITGSGTVNFLPKFTGASIVGDSQILDNGTNVGIGAIYTASKVNITDITLANSGALAGSALSVKQTWNTTGNPTAIDLDVTNTASGATAKLIDLKVGGVSKFSVISAAGSTKTILTASTVDNGDPNALILQVLSPTGVQVAAIRSNGVYVSKAFQSNDNNSFSLTDVSDSYTKKGLNFNNSSGIYFDTTGSFWGATKDISISRYSAGILGIGNGSVNGNTGKVSVGTVLINTGIDDGINQLQVNGTISASSATLSNQVVVLSQLTSNFLNDGNGIGTVFSNQPRANYGNIGLDAFDFSYSDTASSVFGATGEQSFAVGIDMIVSGYNATGFGYKNTVAGIGDFVTGFNIKSNGYTNSVHGIGHDVTGTNCTVVGQASNIIANSTVDFNVADDYVFVVGNGTIQNADPDYNVLTRSNALVINKAGNIGIGIAPDSNFRINVFSVVKVASFTTTINDPLGGLNSTVGTVHLGVISGTSNTGGTLSFANYGGSGVQYTGVKLHSRKFNSTNGNYLTSLVAEVCTGTNLEEVFRANHLKNVIFKGRTEEVLETYADNAAALTGGLYATCHYKTATGQVMIVY